MILHKWLFPAPYTTPEWGKSRSYGDYYIDEEKYQKLKACKVEKGDLLISLVGTFGKIAVVPEVFEEGIINPRLMKIAFDKQKANP
jgi:type I restriction enzyme S subunit